MSYYPPRFLFRRFELLKLLNSGERFLEIGPGRFNLTLDILARFSQGVLIEYNEKAEEAFNSIFTLEIRKNLTLKQIDFFEYKSSVMFDSIIACEVMEHIEEDKMFLQRVFNLLKKEGQLILSMPAKRKFWSIHDESVGHLRRYEKKELTYLLKTCGFSDIKILSYGFPFVNILRFFRVALAKKHYTRYEQLTLEEQTKDSGVSHYRNMSSYLGFFVNCTTIKPFAYMASLFRNFDFSNGYIVSCIKSQKITK